MPELPPDLVIATARYFPLLFIAAWGACVGSLINVLAYRIPLGLSVVSPPSRCPHCQTRLTWRENIPVLGWIFLRGKCRFCRTPISPEYPIVEAIVAVLFTGLVALWMIVPNPYGTGPVLLGLDLKAVQPEWARLGAATVWPYMLVILVMVGSLVAMTIIDAKTYTIPLVIPWFATVAALVIHVAHAVYIQYTDGQLKSGSTAFYSPTLPYRWVLPSTETYRMLGACIGAVAGLGVGVLMLRLGLITRSFADYEEWEKKTLAASGSATEAAPATSDPQPDSGAAATNVVDAVAASPATPVSPPSPTEDSPAQMWIQYPHARREMIRELAFLAPAAALGYLGYFIASWIWPPAAPLPPGQIGFTLEPHWTPLWAEALGGVLLGYLIGGGIVWAVRIFGSLGFGKEAMGLGDVHLLAAVGACVGWIYAVLAFFAAAFVGVAWAIVAAISGGRVKRAMPYGPFLAIATLLVMLFKPAIVKGINLLVMTPPGGLPINFP